MSLILEALKKSEANRRLGQAPDLGTPFTPARRERSPVWALLAIALSLGAGLWWWFGRGAPAPAAKPPIAAASPTVPIRHAQSTPKSTPAVRAAGVGGNAQPSRSDEQIWVAAQRKPDASGHSAEHAAPPAAPTVAQSRPEPAPAQPARTPKTADMRGYAPPPQPHPETAPPTPAAPKLDVPTYYDLPFATRKALPQLSLSMHVYTADPKRRFVILDGTRMAEGDTTSDSVTVREIRPDGVVLEFQGQRFFYPRDGL